MVAPKRKTSADDAAQPGLLFLLDHHRVRFGVCILPHAGDLPRHLDVGRAGPRK